MLSYRSTIDTDSGIATILSNFSTEFINNIIDDSLKIKFKPFGGPMPNIVDVLERDFYIIKDHAPDYIEKVSDVRLESYKEIILKICSYYGFSFMGDFESMAPEEIYGIAHVMYDVFISRFTDYMIDLFVRYIVNNADSIAAYLNEDKTSNKPKESGLYNNDIFKDSKFMIIHANINKVIYNMAGYDIPLQVLLSYLLDANTANRLGSLLMDNNDVYKNHYAFYIKDQRYSASIYTKVKLELQARIQEVYKLQV